MGTVGTKQLLRLIKDRDGSCMAAGLRSVAPHFVIPARAGVQELAVSA